MDDIKDESEAEILEFQNMNEFGGFNMGNKNNNQDNKNNTNNNISNPNEENNNNSW